MSDFALAGHCCLAKVKLQENEKCRDTVSETDAWGQYMQIHAVHAEAKLQDDEKCEEVQIQTPGVNS